MNESEWSESVREKTESLRAMLSDLYERKDSPQRGWVLLVMQETEKGYEVHLSQQDLCSLDFVHAAAGLMQVATLHLLGAHSDLPGPVHESVRKYAELKPDERSLARYRAAEILAAPLIAMLAAGMDSLVKAAGLSGTQASH